MTNFFEEFTRISGGKFSMLKLNSATYYKEKRELTVRFIISAFEVHEFETKQINEVQAILNGMFDGVKVTAQYIRTYADNNVVKNKVLEYFNRTNQMIFRRFDEKNLTINVSDKDVDVKLTFETPLFKMLGAGNMLEGLKDYLDLWFNQNVDVTAEEIVVDLKEIVERDEIVIETSVVSDDSVRLIETRIGGKIYAKGKAEGISQLPNYITDVRGASENIVLCGKISNISKRMYKNKRYNPDDAKSGPEELPLVRFMLDDTTAKIEGVCFPKIDDADKIVNLAEQSTVICSGNVSISTYNNALSFTVNAIFEADIDFKSIHLTQIKPVPENYTTVKPQPYNSVSQASIFSDDDGSVADFFKNKTIVVCDFEATDKFPETALPIELSAVKIENGKYTETFSTLINPNTPIPAIISELTHIDDEMVSDAPDIKDVLPDFFKFTRGAAISGHNIAGYDYPLLAKYANKFGYNFDNEIIDTLLLAKKFLPEFHSFKLVDLSKRLNLVHENAHRAMSDVLATAELLKIIAKRMN